VSEQLERGITASDPQLTDDGVQQMIELAERIRQANGGVLDDTAILAVSEATGAPPEYVRLAIKLRPSTAKESTTQSMRNAFLAFEPDVRRHVVSGLAAFVLAAAHSFSDKSQDPFGLFGIVLILSVSAAIYNAAVSRESRTAAFTGAVFGVVYFILHALFNAILGITGLEAFLLVPTALASTLVGLVVHKIVSRHRNKLGLTDPVRERQQLLVQLVDLQEKLRSGEQTITFVSLDIVGSTRMKQSADPLSVEFTFNEYHKFVEMIARRYGGRVHSTAGDGITLAFDHPQQAFGAARTIQTGLIELNTFKNKIGTPIVLRCGIHYGTVVAPDASDVKTINFASVIDIAAHLQKVCPKGGIVVSEAAAKLLPGGQQSVGTEKVEIESQAGYVWLPKTSLTSTNPPPTPMPVPTEG
jgi:class 3 adenylate cyclase